MRGIARHRSAAQLRVCGCPAHLHRIPIISMILYDKRNTSNEVYCLPNSITFVIIIRDIITVSCNVI